EAVRRSARRLPPVRFCVGLDSSKELARLFPDRILAASTADSCENDEPGEQIRANETQQARMDGLGGWSAFRDCRGLLYLPAIQPGRFLRARWFARPDAGRVERDPLRRPVRTALDRRRVVSGMR